MSDLTIHSGGVVNTIKAGTFENGAVVSGQNGVFATNYSSAYLITSEVGGDLELYGNGYIADETIINLSATNGTIDGTDIRGSVSTYATQISNTIVRAGGDVTIGGISSLDITIGSNGKVTLNNCDLPVQSVGAGGSLCVNGGCLSSAILCGEMYYNLNNPLGYPTVEGCSATLSGGGTIHYAELARAAKLDTTLNTTTNSAVIAPTGDATVYSGYIYNCVLSAALAGSLYERYEVLGHGMLERLRERPAWGAGGSFVYGSLTMNGATGSNIDMTRGGRLIASDCASLRDVNICNVSAGYLNRRAASATFKGLGVAGDWLRGLKASNAELDFEDEFFLTEGCFTRDSSDKIILSDCVVNIRNTTDQEGMVGVELPPCSSGSCFVGREGRIENTTVDSGWELYVGAGSFARHTWVNSGSYLHILGSGDHVDAHISSGAGLIVSSEGTIDSVYISGGYLDNGYYSSGTDSYGNLWESYRGGGSIYNCHMESGATACNGASGCINTLHMSSGCVLSNMSAGVINGASISSGATVINDVFGAISGVSVFDGAVLSNYSCGAVNDACVHAAGFLYNDGTLYDLVLSSGGQLYNSGATTYASVSPGAFLYNLHNLSLVKSATVYGALDVSSGTVLDSIVNQDGIITILSGGSGTTCGAFGGGKIVVKKSGCISNCSAAYPDGRIEIERGGVAEGTLIEYSAEVIVNGGSSANNFIFDRGTLYILDGVVTGISGTGGSVHISGGSAVSITGGEGWGDQNTIIVHPGGYAADMQWCSVTVSSGGSAVNCGTVEKKCTIYVESGGIVSGGTVDGQLHVASGGCAYSIRDVGLTYYEEPEEGVTITYTADYLLMLNYQRVVYDDHPEWTTDWEGIGDDSFINYYGGSAWGGGRAAGTKEITSDVYEDEEEGRWTEYAMTWWYQQGTPQQLQATVEDIWEHGYPTP